MAEGIELLDMVEEVASGGLNPALQPVLASVLAKAKKRTAVVLVFTLDWLSRDVRAISGLMAGPVRFVVAELGIDVDPFALHIYAVLAEKERRMIGQRTSAALERKMISGRKAGNLTP
jgi:DNA invertase Pin-like site-specific DNA recombinase